MIRQLVLPTFQFLFFEISPENFQQNAQQDAFMEESRRQRKPRTSDPNFNAEKTNLIVNYLPQVRLSFLMVGINLLRDKGP